MSLPYYIPDCPSSLSVREAECLQRWAEGKLVVEAGALLGFSTIKLAQVASRVISIDRHLNYTLPTLKQFKGNLVRAGVRDKVTIVVECCLSALPRYPAEFGFIDLTGQQRLTQLALEACQAPIVGVHDLHRPYCEGVETAIRKAGFEVLEAVDTLAICRRKIGG